MYLFRYTMWRASGVLRFAAALVMRLLDISAVCDYRLETREQISPCLSPRISTPKDLHKVLICVYVTTTVARLTKDAHIR